MPSPQPIQLVWFKRDLRVSDHRPLCEAARRGPCLCLYVFEPDVIGAEDYDACHLAFVNESLAELRSNLRHVGGELVIRRGEVPQVFAEIHREHPIGTVWAHEETGNAIPTPAIATSPAGHARPASRSTKRRSTACSGRSARVTAGPDAGVSG